MPNVPEATLSLIWQTLVSENFNLPHHEHAPHHEQTFWVHWPISVYRLKPNRLRSNPLQRLMEPTVGQDLGPSRQISSLP